MKKIFYMILSIFMIAVLVIGGLQLFAKDKMKPSNWGKKDETPDEDVGGLVVTPEDSEAEAGHVGKMTLRVAPIARENLGDYGLDAASVESAVTITATFTPESTTNQNISWDAKFANPSSEWATGKEISNYLSIVTSKKQAVVTCKEAFGEKIILTATPESNPDLAKTCTFDYVARPISVNVGEWISGRDTTFSDSLTVRFNYATSIGIQVEYGVGTLRGVLYVESFTLKMNETFKDLINPYLIGAGYTIHAYEHYYAQAEQISSAISYSFPAPSTCFLTPNLQAEPSRSDAERIQNFTQGFVAAADSSQFGEGTLTLNYTYKYADVEFAQGEATTENVNFVSSGVEVVASDFAISEGSHVF